MTHSSLAKGVGLGARSKETIDREWNDLATRLNAHGGGATKTGQRWKRYWADLKFKTKNRAALRRREASGTGCGPATLDQLSETDRKILAIIGEGAVYGDTQHRVPAFPSQTLLTQSTSTMSTSILDMENNAIDYHDEVVVNISESPPPASITSPSSRGHTSTVYTMDASAAVQDSPRPSTPRRILESPVNQRMRGSRNQNSNCVPRTTVRTGHRVGESWVVELEQRRVDAESKLADAAVITAAAARTQAEAARLQAEASLSIAQALHEQTVMVNKLFDILSKK